MWTCEINQDIKKNEKSDCHIIVYHIASQVYNLPYVLWYILYTIYRLNIHVYSDLYCIIGYRWRRVGFNVNIYMTTVVGSVNKLWSYGNLP